MGCDSICVLERAQAVGGSGELAVEVLAVVAHHRLALRARPLHRVAVVTHQASGLPGLTAPVLLRDLQHIFIVLSNHSTSYVIIIIIIITIIIILMNTFSIALFPVKNELNALNYKCTTDE